MELSGPKQDPPPLSPPPNVNGPETWLTPRILIFNTDSILNCCCCACGVVVDALALSTESPGGASVAPCRAEIDAAERSLDQHLRQPLREDRLGVGGDAADDFAGRQDVVDQPRVLAHRQRRLVHIAGLPGREDVGQRLGLVLA